MPLNNQRKKQLEGVIKQMEANNEPFENVQEMVNTFRSKYGTYSMEERKSLASEVSEGRGERQAQVAPIGRFVGEIHRIMSRMILITISRA